MCAWCKRIKVNGNWQQVSADSLKGATITHSICVDCKAKHFPSLTK